MKSTFYAMAGLLGLATLSGRPASAQGEKQLTDMTVYSDPSVLGMARGKGISIEYERHAPFDMDSKSYDPAIGQRTAKVQRYNKFEAKANLPVFLKPRLKVLLGVKYVLQEYNFQKGDSLNYGLYQNLEDKDLKTLGGSLSVLYSFNERNFLLTRLTGDLNGDYDDSPLGKAPYLKTSMVLMYGWKRDENYAYGFGAQVSYNFGRQRLLPAFMYNRTFNHKWGIEAVLPAQLNVRYNASDYTFLYVGYRIVGAAYFINVNNPAFSKYKDLELRHSGIRAQFAVEREVFDFVWVGMEAGYQYNLNNTLVQEKGSNWDAIIRSRRHPAPFVSVGLYLVTPRKFVKKNLPRRLQQEQQGQQ